MAWATAVMGAVAYGGPLLLSAAGLGPRLSAALVAVSALAVLASLAPWLRRVFEKGRDLGVEKAVAEP